MGALLLLPSAYNFGEAAMTHCTAIMATTLCRVFGVL
jgi:hypothetical protein